MSFLSVFNSTPGGSGGNLLPEFIAGLVCCPWSCQDLLQKPSFLHLWAPSPALPGQIRLYSAQPGARLPEEPLGISGLSCLVPVERKGGTDPLQWTIWRGTESSRMEERRMQKAETEVNTKQTYRRDMGS